MSSKDAGPAVLSLQVQAAMGAPRQRGGPFEVLVRHFLDRLLSSESLGSGEEATTRATQMAYAVALPGLLVALFLSPLYHAPSPRLFWSQASDHFFYVMYGFVVMGLVTVLQWDLLFPDLLDVYVLASMPITAKRLLLARIMSLTIFLGTILVGTNILGVIFLPSIADLHGIWWRHIASHAVAVGIGGLFASTSLIALQGMFICFLGQRVARKVSPLVQVLCIVVLLTILFLFPVLSHFLKPLLESNSTAVRWFPPFWFLGIYERLLWGDVAPPIFYGLAHTGLSLTAVTTGLALVAYPLAYARRVKQVVEGTGMRSEGSWGRPFHTLLHATFLRNPRRRAIYHLVGQTLWRTQRLRLLLAVFAGLGLAMATAETVTLHIGDTSIGFGLSPYGMRLAVPVMAFWTVAGLRTALLSPIGRAGGWALRVIHGRPKFDHLRATEMWVAISTAIVALATVVILHSVASAELHGGRVVLVQVMVAIGVSVLLTEAFFLRVMAIPFTEEHPYSVNDLSFVVVIYFLLFPVFALTIVGYEPWMEASAGHLLCTLAGTVAVCWFLRWMRTRYVAADACRLDMEEEILIPGEMGLRG
ncbi:hypothetical protein [Granulicella arctica]|uniref:Uncharacterized protein n=1 Tax=Granulicella arctica TaxID=940613 RepID=A0A7Y9PFD3_9BACT|nr:hypothetical protein [Granulicella arctica]NYF78886.1 hypothetical protein [Granulicella arctica]